MKEKYWSYSKFADVIRGTEKPLYASGDGWYEWKKEAKKKHPIRFWIVEEGFDYVQEFVNWPINTLYKAKYYVTNRWIDQSNALVAHRNHIKPGDYMDLSERMLICLFDELVDFVEIEKAYSNYRWSEEKQKGMKWWQVGRWRTRTWRSAEAGIEHLKWEMTLDNSDFKKDEEPVVLTGQALDAKEILDLYTWWTETYPNRPDPYEVSGWSDYCADKCARGYGLFRKDPTENKQKTSEMLDQIRKMEEEYAREEEEMLIRLIKIRKGLWT